MRPTTTAAAAGNVEPTTIVIFRIWRAGDGAGDPIALFPLEKADNRGHVLSYEHIGQHGAADLGIVQARTRAPRSPVEYASLYRELTAIGYRLDVRKRCPARRSAAGMTTTE